VIFEALPTSFPRLHQRKKTTDHQMGEIEMTRYIVICNNDDSGPFEIIFLDPNNDTPEKDYLVPGRQKISDEGEWDIDIDASDCPLEYGETYSCRRPIFCREMVQRES